MNDTFDIRRWWGKSLPLLLALALMGPACGPSERPANSQEAPGNGYDAAAANQKRQTAPDAVAAAETSPRPAPKPEPKTEAKPVPKAEASPKKPAFDSKGHARRFATVLEAMRYFFAYRKHLPGSEAEAWKLVCGKTTCTLPALVLHDGDAYPTEDGALVARPGGGFWLVEHLGNYGAGGSEEEPWKIVFQKPAKAGAVRICGYAEAYEPIYGDYAGARKGPSEGYTSSTTDLDVATGAITRGDGCFDKTSNAQSEDLVRRGRRLTRKGDYAAAIKAFSKAAWHSPKHPPAYSGRGYARLKKGDLDAADADFRKALTLAKNDRFKGQVLFNLATLEAQRSDLAKAVGHLEASLKARPDHAATTKRLQRLRKKLEATKK